MPEDWARPIFVRIGRQARTLLPVALIGYCILLAAGIYGLRESWPANDGRWLWLKGLYGALTIGAPLFFFCEYLAHSERRLHESNDARKERLQDLKNIQDQGRAVWLACATIIGLILFKTPG